MEIAILNHAKNQQKISIKYHIINHITMFLNEFRGKNKTFLIFESSLVHLLVNTESCFLALVVTIVTFFRWIIPCHWSVWSLILTGAGAVGVPRAFSPYS